MTTATGAPIGVKDATMSVGNRGPLLLQDVNFLDELSHFDRERIPERVVHAKGAGAFGYFEVTHPEIKVSLTEIAAIKLNSEFNIHSVSFRNTRQPRYSNRLANVHQSLFVSQRSVVRAVALIPFAIHAALLLNSIQKMVFGIWLATIRQFSSFEIQFSSHRSSTLKRGIKWSD